MRGCLKISKLFFLSGCSRLFKFFGKPYRFPKIFVIDVITFTMSHNFRTVVFVIKLNRKLVERVPTRVAGVELAQYSTFGLVTISEAVKLLA